MPRLLDKDTDPLPRKLAGQEQELAWHHRGGNLDTLCQTMRLKNCKMCTYQYVRVHTAMYAYILLYLLYDQYVPPTCRCHFVHKYMHAYANEQSSSSMCYSAYIYFLPTYLCLCLNHHSRPFYILLGIPILYNLSYSFYIPLSVYLKNLYYRSCYFFFAIGSRFNVEEN